MIDEWISFLSASGGRVNGAEITDFGDVNAEIDAASRSNVVADLSHLGLIEVAGEDAATFLQGQFTNDVRLVDEERSQLSAYCSAKGRALATFRLFRRDDRLFLRMPAPLVEPTLGRLRKYVLRSKVTLEDGGEHLLRLGLSGPEAIQILGLAPSEVDGVTRSGDLSILRVPGLQPRFELFGSAETIRPLWAKLTERALLVGSEAWGWTEVAAGLPNVYPETVEAFIPQMLNLQLLNGVSFKKGCYTGQEVVARTHYLGKLKRRMFLARVESAVRPKIGEELYSPASESGQGTGKVVDLRGTPEKGYDLLAVIQVGEAAGGGVRLRDAAGPLLQLRELPYPVDDGA